MGDPVTNTTTIIKRALLAKKNIFFVKNKVDAPAQHFKNKGREGEKRLSYKMNNYVHLNDLRNK